MCSIFLSNKKNLSIDEVNRFIKLRGPDHTQVYELNGFTFIHNLLSISGDYTVQPFIEDGIIALFNGEIYNYNDFGSYRSDGECLIPLYLNYGDLFSRLLDGEFALAIMDLKKQQIILSTDVFSTKPLYISIEDESFAISSYASAIKVAGFKKIIKLEPNSIYRFDLTNNEIIKLSECYNFSLKQYKNSFDDWFDAFESSVKKRSVNCREKLFIGLSGGYDSGAISCVLNKLNVNYSAYTVLGKERVDILDERVKLINHKSNHQYISPSDMITKKARKYINENVEELYYKTYSLKGDYNEFSLSLHDDSGSTGLSMICEEARLNNCKVYLSGQGADEIISDYGFNGQRIYPHSNFGGYFPEKLEDIFPWPSFYGSSQESYLMKEEHVAGSYGIEARYPFLDKRLVQEFLSLSDKLKNYAYKSVLRAYLEKNEYPCKFDEKIGF
jgi:asparagine synthetase B (glutamine-hydrolysing)